MTKSPVILASIGSYSGVVGVPLVPILQGAQLWVKFINGKGGLGGHPVTLKVYDDGGDPARSRAAAGQAIERDKAIAFLQNSTTVTGGALVEYITSKGVPVVGTDSETAGTYTSPMYFPQVSSLDAGTVTLVHSLAQQTIPGGKNKLGMIYCSEVAACAAAERIMAKEARDVGFDYAYSTGASIAQPDYTAECLQARNRGVHVLILYLDQNSVNRFAASCARQSYRPIYSMHSGAVTDRHKDDPSLHGSLTAFRAFPYFQTGTPATDEFAGAMRTYGQNIPSGEGPAMGWVSGKLMEQVGPSLSEPPTSESILKGLWSLRNNDLGGTTLTLSFEAQKPAVPKSCWFNVGIKDGRWISTDGYVRHCL